MKAAWPRDIKPVYPVKIFKARALITDTPQTQETKTAYLPANRGKVMVNSMKITKDILAVGLGNILRSCW